MTAPAQGPRTAALLEQVEALQSALDRAGDRLAPEVAAGTGAGIAAVRERLELGIDHTIVALVGGTGSGKSTLFNSLSGLEFAEVGVRRPTTSRVTACVWAHDATALLDWLDVDPDRRIERESALDGESQADLRGLVLLDLPDHDSVEPEHRAVVDRLVPMVDLLVWVVDPQKYADDALHTGYLRHLVGHEGAMLVLLNQVDTVPVGRRAELLADVARLLREDGLVDVRTIGVSARTGEGLREIRGVLAGLVEGRSGAEVRAAAELGDAAAALRAGVGTSEPEPPVSRAVAALAEAAGLAGAVQAVRAGPSPERASLGPVQADRVALVREAWLREVGASLPARWERAVQQAVDDSSELTQALDRGLGEVPVPVLPRVGASRWLVPLLLGLAALGAAALGLGALLGETGGSAAYGWLGAALALALGAALTPVVRARRRRAAAGLLAEELRAAGTAAIESVVAAGLTAPTAAVLADHRAVRTVAGPAIAAGAPSRQDAEAAAGARAG